MEYKHRAKNRRLKRNIISLTGILKFKWLNFSIGEKISFIWVCINILSLFLTWIDSINWEERGTSFSSLAWLAWYIMFFTLILLFFILLSHSRKEKLKLYSNIHFKDSTIIILWWIFNIFLSLNIFSFVEWIRERFSSTIIQGNGIILSITWAIVIIIWGLIIRKEKRTEKYSIYTNELWNEENEEENDKNMKLPF